MIAGRTEGHSSALTAIAALRMSSSVPMPQMGRSSRWRPARRGSRHIAAAVAAVHSSGLGQRFGSGTSTPTTGTAVGAAAATVVSTAAVAAGQRTA